MGRGSSDKMSSHSPTVANNRIELWHAGNNEQVRRAYEELVEVFTRLLAR